MAANWTITKMNFDMTAPRENCKGKLIVSLTDLSGENPPTLQVYEDIAMCSEEEVGVALEALTTDGFTPNTWE